MIDPNDNAGGTATLAAPAIDRAANTASRFHIPGDKINLETASLPEDQRDAIRWAAMYCRAKNLHVSEFAALLKKPNGEPYSKDSVVHMFTGGRDESALVPMVAAIQRIRRLEDARAEQTRAPFVETRLAKRIHQVCRRAHDRQALVFIFGESQIGKSVALEHEAASDPVNIKYVRMPTGGGLCAFLRELARSLGIPNGNSIEDLKARIINTVDQFMLILVDECEECLNDKRDSSKGVTTLNFIREIYDRKKCGVVIAGAPDLKRGLYTGRHAEAMRRLVRRSMIPLQLPAQPSAADLATFARHFGLPEIPDAVAEIKFTAQNLQGDDYPVSLKINPTELQAKIIRTDGLGRWVKILIEASDLAKEKRKPISWGFVIRAWHWLSTMESMNDDQPQAEAA